MEIEKIREKIAGNEKYSSINLDEFNFIYDLNSKNDTGTYYLPAELKFENTVLGNSSSIIGEYQISPSFKEKYQYCPSEDKCYDGTYMVRPESTGKGNVAVLKLKISANIDKNIFFSKYFKYPSDLIKYYGKIRCEFGDTSYTYTPLIISTKYQKDTYTYIEVPKELNKASKIELILSIRGIKYTIVLK